jgi:pseudouridylate synthase
VIGYRCDELPAFYRRSSGLRLAHRSDSVVELAAILRQHWHALGGQGVLIANPIPVEAELPAEQIDHVIEAALARAAEGGISGKALTPFLLTEIAGATRGQAVIANRALAVHNAEVGAELAGALAGAGGADAAH